MSNFYDMQRSSGVRWALLLLLVVHTSNRFVTHGLEFQYKGNPLISHVSSADPDAHVWDDTVWVYSSTDGNLREHGYSDSDPWTYAYMDGYHVFSTNDMIHWEDHGEIFHSRNVPWGGEGWMWAPGAARKNGIYYLYYPHKDWEGIWRIGVATARSPVGPFQDIGKPLEGISGIDPMIFIDDDGQAYIYCNDHQVAKLKDNMIELAELPRVVDYGPSWVQEDYELMFEEGSYMHKYNGKYIYSYSNWQAGDTTAYYGIGDSPYGPFEWQGGLAPSTRGSPDHHSIIQFRGYWWYFYHMDTPWQDKASLNWYGHRRLACFDKMYHNSDATIQLIERTYGNPSTSIGINAGSSSFVAGDGMLFTADQYYLDIGRIDSTEMSISGTDDDFLYQSNRFDFSFEYQIPVENGSYRVTLKFAEIYHDSAEKRRFNVNIEDAEVISDLDLFALVGKNAAYDQTFTVDVNDGSLSISFGAIVDNAQVNALLVQRLESFEDPCDPDPCDAGFRCVTQGLSQRECVYKDPCESGPCDAFSTCVDLGNNQHKCEFTNPCDAGPCQSFETCLDIGQGSHECQYINPCRSGPCESFETCLDVGEGNHECRYRNPCKADPCSDYETCVDQGSGNHECQYINPCDTNTCSPFERCLDLGEGGHECQYNNPCDSNPCPPFYSCLDLGSGNHKCKYKDPCDASPCKFFETCIDYGNSTSSCEYNDPCAADPCEEFHTCIDLGQGKHKCRYNDPCDSNPCEDYEFCADLGNSTHLCEYINPCENKPCLTLGSGYNCVNRGTGNFECLPPATPLPTSSPTDAPSSRTVLEPTMGPSQSDAVTKPVPSRLASNPADDDEEKVTGLDQQEFDKNDSENSDTISPPESGSHTSKRSIGWLVAASIAGAALIITLLFVFLRRRRSAKTKSCTRAEEGPSILPVHCTEGPYEETSDSASNA